MLRDALLLAIRESEGMTFDNAKARDGFVDNLLNAMATELFGEGAKTGDPASPSRALVDLYENCAEWTEGACDVQALNLTGPAVELGDADWLTWEVAEDTRCPTWTASTTISFPLRRACSCCRAGLWS